MTDEAAAGPVNRFPQPPYFGRNSAFGLILMAQGKLPYYPEFTAGALQLFHQVLPREVLNDGLHYRRNAQIALSAIVGDRRNFDVKLLADEIDGIRVPKVLYTVDPKQQLHLRADIDKLYDRFQQVRAYRAQPISTIDYKLALEKRAMPKPPALIRKAGALELPSPPYFSAKSVSSLKLLAWGIRNGELEENAKPMMKYILPECKEKEMHTLQQNAAITLSALAGPETSETLEQLKQALFAALEKRQMAVNENKSDKEFQREYHDPTEHPDGLFYETVNAIAAKRNFQVEARQMELTDYYVQMLRREPAQVKDEASAAKPEYKTLDLLDAHLKVAGIHASDAVFVQLRGSKFASVYVNDDEAQTLRSFCKNQKLGFTVKLDHPVHGKTMFYIKVANLERDFETGEIAPEIGRHTLNLLNQMLARPAAKPGEPGERKTSTQSREL